MTSENITIKLLRGVLLTGLVASISACTNDMSDLQNYAQEVRARKSGDIEPIPEIVPYEAFIYEEAGRRDPFKSLKFFAAIERGSGGIQPDLTRRKEPLEDYPLDSLDMVGTITKADTLYALVRAGNGVIHRVTIGNHMGQNFGRIVGISEYSIDLLEVIPDGFGGYMEQDAVLAMSEE